MLKRRKFSTKERLVISERANGCCEYCKSDEQYSTDNFTIDHTVPLSEGGTHDLENLALACNGCNGLKKHFLIGFDDVLQTNIDLFNPRKMKWDDHFKWSENYLEIEASTPTGRVTIKMLKLNRSKVINLRRALIALGVHPKT